ncbi:unnamed protein product, partial [Prorocentrum cordatum]
ARWLFDAFATGKKKVLRSAELFQYATLIGYDGPGEGEAWLSHLDDLCRRLGTTPSRTNKDADGVTLSQFSAGLGPDGPLATSGPGCEVLLALLGHREWLAWKAFRLLDVDGAGSLGAAKLAPFLAFCGSSEARQLHGLGPGDSVDYERFVQMLDHPPQWPNSALQALLSQLDCREELVAQLFRTLSLYQESRQPRPASGVLSSLLLSHPHRVYSEQLLVYAETLEFAGSDEEWGEEWGNICRTYSIGPESGLAPEQFVRMVNDDDSPGSALPWQLHLSLRRLGCRCALVRKLFRHLCDRDRPEGRIGPHGLLKQARRCGFNEEDDQWGPVYEGLGERFGWDCTQGVPLKDFLRMLEQEDCELRYDDGALRDLFEIMDRRDLVVEVFNLMDANGTHRLESDEMRQYADHLGFDGDDEVWEQDYLQLLGEQGWAGPPDLEEFMAAVDDDGSPVCATDRELRLLLAKMGRPVLSTLPGQARRRRAPGGPSVEDSDEDELPPAAGRQPPVPEPAQAFTPRWGEEDEPDEPDEPEPDEPDELAAPAAPGGEAPVWRYRRPLGPTALGYTRRRPWVPLAPRASPGDAPRSPSTEALSPGGASEAPSPGGASEARARTTSPPAPARPRRPGAAPRGRAGPGASSPAPRGATGPSVAVAGQAAPQGRRWPTPGDGPRVLASGASDVFGHLFRDAEKRSRFRKRVEEERVRAQQEEAEEFHRKFPVAESREEAERRCVRLYDTGLRSIEERELKARKAEEAALKKHCTFQPKIGDPKHVLSNHARKGGMARLEQLHKMHGSILGRRAEQKESEEKQELLALQERSVHQKAAGSSVSRCGDLYKSALELQAKRKKLQEDKDKELDKALEQMSIHSRPIGPLTAEEIAHKHHEVAFGKHQEKLKELKERVERQQDYLGKLAASGDPSGARGKAPAKELRRLTLLYADAFRRLEACRVQREKEEQDELQQCMTVHRAALERCQWSEEYQKLVSSHLHKGGGDKGRKFLAEFETPPGMLPSHAGTPDAHSQRQGAAQGEPLGASSPGLAFPWKPRGIRRSRSWHPGSAALLFKTLGLDPEMQEGEPALEWCADAAADSAGVAGESPRSPGAAVGRSSPRSAPAAARARAARQAVQAAARAAESAEAAAAESLPVFTGAAARAAGQRGRWGRPQPAARESTPPRTAAAMPRKAVAPHAARNSTPPPAARKQVTPRDRSPQPFAAALRFSPATGRDRTPPPLSSAAQSSPEAVRIRAPPPWAGVPTAATRDPTPPPAARGQTPPRAGADARAVAQGRTPTPSAARSLTPTRRVVRAAPAPVSAAEGSRRWSAPGRARTPPPTAAALASTTRSGPATPATVRDSTPTSARRCRTPPPTAARSGPPGATALAGGLPPYTPPLSASAEGERPFDGFWTHASDPGGRIEVIEGGTLHWQEGEQCTISPKGPASFEIELEGVTHTAELRGGRLVWEDGDTWVRVHYDSASLNEVSAELHSASSGPGKHSFPRPSNIPGVIRRLGLSPAPAPSAAALLGDRRPPPPGWH